MSQISHRKAEGSLFFKRLFYFCMGKRRARYEAVMLFMWFNDTSARSQGVTLSDSMTEGKREGLDASVPEQSSLVYKEKTAYFTTTGYSSLLVHKMDLERGLEEMAFCIKTILTVLSALVAN